jgi:DNA (cytosine-5)-methyltransferase 1
VLWPIATWNPARSVWEIMQDALCGHSVPFLETFPPSGTMRNGVIYELPTPEAAISGSESFSSLGLLPTPVASFSANTPKNHLRKKPGRTRVTDLRILVENGLIASGGRLLAGQEEYELLPTPSVALGTGGQSSRSGARKGELLLGGIAQALGFGIVDWGIYARAVLRWQQVTGRMVPSPTELSPKGSAVLAPVFVEWMMGLAGGWVTQVPGVNRKAQFKILGNGVVPQQALLALSLLWEDYQAERLGVSGV